MGSMISIIVTGGGAPGTVGTIHALKNNPDNMNFRIITVDTRDNVVGKYVSDMFYKVPRPEDHAYIQVMEEIARKERVKVIIPQTTREIEILAKYRHEFLKCGINVIISDFKSVTIANNKFVLLEKAKEIGIPCPVSELTNSREEFIKTVKQFGYPKKKVVIKPLISNGMRGLRILTKDPWDVQRFLSEKPEGVEVDLAAILKILERGKWPKLLVSEYLEGLEYTVDVFRNALGTIAIPRLRDTIRSGITFDSTVVMRKDLIDYSKKLAEHVDLTYCFGFQFKLSRDGVPKLLECNPRVQGTMIVSAFAGFNMIYYSVKEALGYEVLTSDPVLRDQIQFKRYWGGIAINDEGCIGRI